MVPQENAPREGVGEEGAGGAGGMKPALQPGIQLPSPTSIQMPPASILTPGAVVTPGTSSPDVQSQRSSFERPRSRSRDVSAGAGTGTGTGTPTSSAPSRVAAPGTDEPRDMVVQSFAPRVAVYTSPDADEIIRIKGLYGGLCALLRPFGECVQGNVVVRDSIGASKSWNDFRICFTEFDRASAYMPSSTLQRHTTTTATSSVLSSLQSQPLENDGTRAAATEEARQRASMLNEVVQNSIAAANRRGGTESGDNSADENGLWANPTTPHFRHLLRGLLADHSMVPYETFTHPVACVIAITSQNASPIETLRDLYNDTRQESDNTPSWTGNDFLRYYVLIHDEDHDDIATSTALFNQMKRHFGLHTHLLRLRGVQCAREDDEAMPVPTCRWMSAEEELAEQRQKGDLIEFDEFQPFVYSSDAVALRTFVREMVTQSVVPFMESRVATWNDQVASRRRGLSGRFISLSKRWGGFGSSKKTESVSSKSNYASALGGYPAESNESQMHRLADYSLMLRDWRLSASIYDMLRADFGDDKAWAHHAVANELMAVSLLLGGSSRGAKAETLDACIDTATYSYITRCGDPFGALRCLIVVIELFRSRGGLAIEEAAKWAYRLLDLALLPPLMQTIITERLAFAYEASAGAGAARFGARARKTAFWHLLGAGAWLAVRDPLQARTPLDRALYGYPAESTKFEGMQAYLLGLQNDVSRQGQMAGAAHPLVLEPSMIDEETKAFDDDTAPVSATSGPMHGKRFSISQPVPPSPGADLLLQLNETQKQEADGFV